MRVAVAMVLVLALALGLGGCAPQGGEMEGEGISAAQGQREEGQDSAAAGGNIEEGGDSAAGEKGTEGGGQGLKVVATIFPPYDFARALTEGTGAQVTMLIKPGVESHSFDPTPEDILTIAEADLFLCIGGHDEAWVDTVLEGQDRGPGRVVKLIGCVETLPQAGQGEHGHEEGRGIDEHIWTSVGNARQMAQAICQALEAADPEGAQAYRANYEDYAAQLEALDQAFQAVVDGGVRREVVFGDRFPFRYFAQDYGLTWYSAFAGCSGEGEPSAADIAFLIDKIQQDGIPVVYHIEQGSLRTAQTIAQEAGVETVLMHSCHNLTVEELERGETYLSLMEGNLQALAQGLN
ncbi:MAG TPA: zinc ABC transporter substrate-binding protein [Candidatus Excrementavichristensenella intestinipullorum]|nr:zinc ABC transporter substrate-binding protein [Candidatus Excrementavichristensenella intestinipullorum]